jgi:agmatinase
MWKSNHATLFGLESSWEQAHTVIFGAPYDCTTSFRPGARFAPAAMRSESFGLESYSPYQDRDLFDYAICDAGDLELPFGGPEKALALIEEQAENLFAAGKRPLMLGGEHLVTLAPVRAALRRYPDLCIVHFDAHTDLREEYLGQPLSHATVMRRCHDLVGDGRIFQFGIRSGLREEFRWAQAHTHLQKHNFDGLEQVLATIGDRPVYFTIDLDVLDPSVFPGTGTPEAGGVTFPALLAAVENVCKLQVIGCDLVELSPNYDHSGMSTAVACKILRELLLALEK